MTLRALRGDRYLVETEGGQYVVNPVADTCECPDCLIRGAQCKHLRRVRLDIEKGQVPAPGERAGVCAVCGERLFVPVDATGSVLCQRHDFEPGTFVRDREAPDRLLVTAVTSQRADEYETEAGRRIDEYDSNAAYGRHEPVVEAVYLSAATSRDGVIDVSGLKRYGFPASRLRRLPPKTSPNNPVIGIRT